jgi:hypothetical protein
MAMVADSRILVTAGSLRLSWIACSIGSAMTHATIPGHRLPLHLERAVLRHFSGTQFGTVLPAFFFVPIFSYPSQHGSDDFFDAFFVVFFFVDFFFVDLCFVDAVVFLDPAFFGAAFFAGATIASRKGISWQDGRSV